MKFARPTYDSKEKMYSSEILDGFRFSSEREDSVFTPTLETFQTQTSLIPTIITLTQGWFSKPLTQEYLTPRLTYSIQNDLPTDFEGTVEWQAKRLTITKDVFTIHCAIVDMKRVEKVVIDFHEDAEAGAGAEAEIPEAVGEVVGIGPTRRMLHKKSVAAARSKAARALFKAERMMQEYTNLYGDSDWETDSDSDLD